MELVNELYASEGEVTPGVLAEVLEKLNADKGYAAEFGAARRGERSDN